MFCQNECFNHEMAISEQKLINERIFKMPKETTTQTHQQQDRLLRLPEVLELIPVSKTSWWNGIKEGFYPPGVKLGPRTRAWALNDIMELVENGITIQEGRKHEK